MCEEGGSQNPWSVDNLDEYLFYCCPQCDHKSKCKPSFVQHALFKHPEAKENIKDDAGILLNQVLMVECIIKEEVVSDGIETNFDSIEVKEEHLAPSVIVENPEITESNSN